MLWKKKDLLLVLLIQKQQISKKMGVTEKGYKELDQINKTIKTYLDGVTKRIAPEEVERVQMILRAFRLDLEKL